MATAAVESVLETDRKKKKGSAGATPLDQYYESLIQQQLAAQQLSPAQLKVNEIAQTAFGTTASSSSAQASLSGTADSSALPTHTSHPYGYNLCDEVLKTLYSPKEALFSMQQEAITRRAKNIYKKLNYLTHLRQRIEKEKTKKDAGKTDPVIDSIDFCLPSFSSIATPISFVKMEKIEKSELVLDSHTEQVLVHHGYNVAALKTQADQDSGKASGSYVIRFNPTVSAKDQTEFSHRLMQCAALEYLQEESQIELLTKEDRARYDFSKLPKKELETFVKALKNLEQVIHTQCDLLPTTANNELSKLQPLQSGQRLIDEAMAETLRAWRKLIDRILERMAASR